MNLIIYSTRLKYIKFTNIYKKNSISRIQAYSDHLKNLKRKNNPVARIMESN